MLAAVFRLARVEAVRIDDQFQDAVV
jgi:hypothetical protein